MVSKKVISAFFGVTVWGFTFLFIKRLLEYMNPMEVIFWRYSIASVIFLGITHISKKKFTLKKEDLKKIIATSVLGIGIYSVFLNVSVGMIGSSHTGVLNGAFPVFAVMFDIIARKNKLTMKKITALFVSMMGIIAISTTKSPESGGFNIGYIIMIVSVIIFVMYSFVTENLIEKYDSIELLGYQSLFGALSVIPINYLFYGKMISGSMLIKTEVITNLALLICACTILSYYLYLKGIEDLGVSTMSFFLNMVPISAMIGGIIFMNEPITINAMIGFVLILVSVKIVTTKEKEGKKIEYPKKVYKKS